MKMFIKKFVSSSFRSVTFVFCLANDSVSFAMLLLTLQPLLNALFLGFLKTSGAVIEITLPLIFKYDCFREKQTYQQIERALRKATSKFLPDAECLPLTDLQLQVKQESGELLVFDDDDNELTRCVVEEWIGNHDEHF